VTVSDTSALYLRDDFDFGRPSLGIENAPRLDLALGWSALQLSLGYGPRLVVAELVGGSSPSLLLLHEASASLRYQRTRTQVAVGHSLSIGEQYLGKLPQASAADPLAPPDPTVSRATPLANSQSLRIRTETTSGLASYLWTRRIASEATVAYGVGGGADGAARALQPRLRTLALASSLRFRWSARQDLGTAAGASRVRTSNGYEHWIATLSEAWSMRWTPLTSSNLSVGAAWRETQRPDKTKSSEPAPIASSSISHLFRMARGNGALQAGASLAPNVNVLTGELQLAVQGSASAGVQRKRSAAELTADALQTLPADATRATRVVGGGIRLTQQTAEWLLLFAGLRLQHQQIADTSLSLALQWAITAGCTLQSSPLTLF
jgi:hypothetical protein